MVSDKQPQVFGGVLLSPCTVKASELRKLARSRFDRSCPGQALGDALLTLKS